MIITWKNPGYWTTRMPWTSDISPHLTAIQKVATYTKESLFHEGGFVTILPDTAESSLIHRLCGIAAA